MLLSWILLIAFCSLGASGQRQGQCQIQRQGQRQGRCFTMRISRKRSNCTCGLAKRTTKGTGVQETEVNEYPWQVAIAAPDLGYNFPICGGVLISNKWVLTGARCQFGDQSKEFGRVWLGEHNWTTGTESQRLVSTIERIIPHPDYNPSYLYFNLALLELSSPVNFAETSNVRPICLPDRENLSQDYAGFTSVTTGWGPFRGPPDVPSPYLQEEKVQVLSQSACQERLDQYQDPDFETELLPSFMCPDRGTACSIGDRGGPLITAGEGDGVTPGQNYELIGVNSAIPKDCSSIFPGFFLRVTEVLPWIQSITGDLDTCPRE